MGMLDWLLDSNGRKWQTKAFSRALDAYRVGDRMPGPPSTYQVEVLGPDLDRRVATVRDGILVRVPDFRDETLLLVSYSGPAPGSVKGSLCRRFDGEDGEADLGAISGFCMLLATHKAHAWTYRQRADAGHHVASHVDLDAVHHCPGVAHDHEIACCAEHGTHVTPHRGCLLR